MWNVVYLWRGERHLHSKQYTDHAEALDCVAQLRWKGFDAWAERVV